jgi:hypothetical protein
LDVTDDEKFKSCVVAIITATHLFLDADDVQKHAIITRTLSTAKAVREH